MWQHRQKPTQSREALRMLNCKFNDTVHQYRYNKARETQKEEEK